MVGSLSQTKRQRYSTSVHTISSTSDDQLSQTLSGSIEDDDENDDDDNDIYALPGIQYKDGVHNHVRKSVLRTKVLIYFWCMSHLYYYYRYPEKGVIIFVIKMLLDGVSLEKLALCLYLMTLNIRK